MRRAIVILLATNLMGCASTEIASAREETEAVTLEYLSALDLLNLCRSGDEREVRASAVADAIACRYFIEGVFWSLLSMKLICPTGTTSGQKNVLVVRRFLRDVPEDLHMHAGLMAAAAFGDSFPCVGIDD